MKLEKILNGNVEEICSKVVETFIKRNRGNSVTESSDIITEQGKTLIRTIEKFSNTLSERISTTLIFVENGKQVHLIIICTGYEGILFTRGPEGKAATLKKMEEIIEELGY